jgi:hypothetical protein
MKIKSALIAILLMVGLAPGVAQANERPVVESFTFTPNDLDLISANTNVAFELVVSHPSGIENTSTLATLTNSLGHTLATYLNRTDSPVNSTLSKVTFKGVLTVPLGVSPGVYNISVAAVSNNSSAGYKYSTDVISPKKIRNLVGGEYGLLVRNNGDLNLSYTTFVGPTHDTTTSTSYDNPNFYNVANAPIFKVGETYAPSKYYELRVPSLSLSISSATPTVCSSDGKDLKFLKEGTCSYTVSTLKTSDYAARTNTQNVTITSARVKPSLFVGSIPTQTAKDLPKKIQITWVYGAAGGYVMPQTITPTVCVASGFFVNIISGGTCIVTYQSEETSSYLASDLYKVSFEVTRDPQTITFAPATTVDIKTKSLTLTATASSGGTVSFASTSTENCTISGSTLNLLKAGKCVITASQTGSSTLAPVSASATITLTGAVIMPKPVVTKKTIVCVKEKTSKKVSGTNPKCPKGFKLKGKYK